MKIGIIGGTGFDTHGWIANPRKKTIRPLRGSPSVSLLTGEISGHWVVAIARHNRDHSYSPTHVPYAANVLALKNEGCTHVIATSACGSLRAAMRPGDVVFVDQFIDMTRHRDDTYYHGRPIHTEMAEPFDRFLRKHLVAASKKRNMRFHPGGTVVTIEGPRFSTRAESRMYRSWGADVINMTTSTEAILAREADLAYQAVAIVTDYDSWNIHKEPVSVSAILERMKRSEQAVHGLIIDTLARLPQ